MRFPWTKNKPIEILVHSKPVNVYIDGRYLVVDMRLSLQSKRGRQVALETAQLLNQLVDSVVLAPKRSNPQQDEPLDVRIGELKAVIPNTVTEK